MYGGVCVVRDLIHRLSIPSVVANQEYEPAMNTKPIHSVFADSNAHSVRLLAVVFAGLITCGTFMSPGCADSNASKNPIPASSDVVRSGKSNVDAISNGTLTPIDSAEPQEVQDKTREEPASDVLETASKLLEKAKLKSGSTASLANKWVQERISGVADTGNQTVDETWKWANETFESLKAQGLTTSRSTTEWLGQDWRNMESWQYKVITLAGTDEELAEKLNQFGKQGWDCFNTEIGTDGTRFYFKKQMFSYLRQLPFKDVIKLVPMMNNVDN